MNSCLYECHLNHARLAPRPHRFAYRIFLFALDLDELDQVQAAVPLFSLDRANLYSFRQRDYFPTTAPLHHPTDVQTAPTLEPTASTLPTLKERVLAYTCGRGIDVSGGRVVLVTLPRIAGSLFNPVSFYFCYDRTGAAVAAIAEVTNTFREMKTYLLPRASDATSAVFRLRIPKHFYVSPFSDVDVEFDFSLCTLGDRLSVRIDDYTNGVCTFRSTLAGRKRDLTAARLAWYAVKYPLLTLRIVARIHGHALMLWLKKVPWFPKAARSADQRDLYHPHASITRPEISAPRTLRLTPKPAVPLEQLT